ncbi:MAG: hypothetical protein SNJ56_04975 [Termitinemataceae bacterium]
MHKNSILLLFLTVLTAFFSIGITHLAAQDTLYTAARDSIFDYLSTYGSLTILPYNNWASGDYDSWSDSFWGYNTPRVNQFRVDMEQTTTTIYEGGLFFKKLNLGLGAAFKTDNNLIGVINQALGFLQFKAFEARIEFSRLTGTAHWLGSDIGLPTTQRFDNQLLNIDLIYYTKTAPIGLYFGIGYSSYSLPVQINCLSYSTYYDSVWWAPVVSFYQPDMKFQIYSGILGFDTLRDALVQHGLSAEMPAFLPWVWTQDRFGVGTASINNEIQSIIEEKNQLTLWSENQIAMLVDYNFTLGLQYVKHWNRLHVGVGIGYNIGGQTVTCITSKGPVQSGYVDASPSVYLVHHGLMIRGSIKL